MTLPSPAMVTWALSMFEMIRAILILRKYGYGGDIAAMVSRMNPDDFFRLQARVAWASRLAVTAQILAWLPGL